MNTYRTMFHSASFHAHARRQTRDHHPLGRLRRSGFSLMELIVVMSVIAIIFSIGANSLRSPGSSYQLVNASNMVSGLMNQARAYAISHNTQAALFVSVSADPRFPDQEYRTVSVWFRNADLGGDWQQLSPWQALPDGIIIDPTPESSTTGEYYFDSSALPNEAEVESRGNTMAVRFVRFNSHGAVNFDGLSSPLLAVRMRLVNGYLEDSVVRYTGAQGADFTAVNWAEVSTDGLTGRVQHHRP